MAKRKIKSSSTTSKEKEDPICKKKVSSRKASKGKKVKKKKGDDQKNNKGVKHPTDHLDGYKWKPGQSGNPAGRPKGSGLTDSMRKYFQLKASKFKPAKEKAKELGMDPKKYSVAEVFIASSMREAIGGDGRSVEHLWERDEGAVQKQLNVTGDAVEDYMDRMDQTTQPPKPKKEKG